VVTVVSGEGDVLVTHLLAFSDGDFFVTTTEYTLGRFVVSFVEQQGGPSHDRILKIQPRRVGMMPDMLLCSSEVVPYQVPVATGVGKTETIGARVLSQISSLSRDMERNCLILGAAVGCGKTSFLVHALADHCMRSMLPLRRKLTSNPEDSEKQVVSVSKLRERINTIDALTRREAELYLDFYEAARKHGIDTKLVPSLNDRDDKISRLSFWSSAILSACAGVLLNMREPFGAIGLAPLSSLAALMWRRFGWSRRLTSQYTATRTILEVLQRDFWNEHDPLSTWREKYRDTEKVAFLFGEDLQPDVRILATVLGHRGYQICLLDPVLQVHHSIIRKRLDTISNAERSTCLFYFSGHGYHDPVVERALWDVAVSSVWYHSASLYSECRDVLRNSRADGPLYF
jgi:hypothetical protein